MARGKGFKSQQDRDHYVSSKLRTGPGPTQDYPDYDSTETEVGEPERFNAYQPTVPKQKRKGFAEYLEEHPVWPVVVLVGILGIPAVGWMIGVGRDVGALDARVDALSESTQRLDRTLVDTRTELAQLLKETETRLADDLRQIDRRMDRFASNPPDDDGAE